MEPWRKHSLQHLHYFNYRNQINFLQASKTSPVNRITDKYGSIGKSTMIHNPTFKSDTANSKRGGRRGVEPNR